MAGLLGKVISILLIVILFVVLKISRKVKCKGVKWIKNKKEHRQPNRRDSLAAAKRTPFDVLVIGGGSTGVGLALDAATRGLGVCLIEKGDLASATSSKSTKLLHGGVRYLDKAMRHFSIRQLLFVTEALYERRIIMDSAPYLSSTIRIFVPIYSKAAMVFYYVLLKLYDWLAGERTLGRSFVVGKEQAKIYNFNMRKDELLGGIVYYDGCMDDSRLNVMIGITASSHGATLLTYVEFLSYNPSTNCVLCIDRITRRKFRIKTKTVINATGSYTDVVRHSLNKKSDMMVHSSGSHICIDPKFGPCGMGLVDKCTADNRMLFVVPWKNNLIAGSTERVVKRPTDVLPTKEDLDFLVNEVNKFNSNKLVAGDVKSIWTGVRPLVKDKAKNSESILRSFKVIDDGDGVITVTGGKWTTYRIAAKETNDLLVKTYGMKTKNGCVTCRVPILGSDGYSRNMYHNLSDVLNVDSSYAKHLQDMYGSSAYHLKNYLRKNRTRILDDHEFTYAEVVYAMENEYAVTLGDIVNRRFRLGFLNVRDAHKAGIKITDYLVEANIWSKKVAKRNLSNFYTELEEFGWSLLNKSQK